MKYVVDTNAYSTFFKGDDRFRKYFEQASIMYVPLVVIGELRGGFNAGTKADYNEKYLQRFLDKPQVSILSLSDKTATIYGLLYAQLKKAGRPIGTNDMWIAALALEHQATLLTMDADFKHVPGLHLAGL